MDTSAPPPPIAKHLVLVGAGNAHLQFIERWRMNPLPGVAVTLVNKAGVIPYSAMVPGPIASDYSWEDSTLDLVRLCQVVGGLPLKQSARSREVAVVRRRKGRRCDC